MNTEEVVESAPRTGGAGNAKKKTKTKAHIHIGPYARAFRMGQAFCPVCDAEKIVKLTEKEKFADWAVRDAREGKKGSR